MNQLKSNTKPNKSAAYGRMKQIKKFVEFHEDNEVSRAIRNSVDSYRINGNPNNKRQYDTTSMAIAENLKLRMKQSEINASQLASHLKVSDPVIGRILNGSAKSINWETLEKICAALGTTVSKITQMTRPHTTLTGIDSIDNLIMLFQACLFQPPDSVKKLIPFFSENYRITYSDWVYGTESRKGPNIEDEWKLNHPNDVIDKVLHGAAIMGEGVLLHQRIVSARPNGTIPLQKTEKTLSKKKPNNFDNVFPTLASVERRRVELVDYWQFSKTIDQIARGAKFQVTDRHIKLLRLGDES